MLDLGWKPSFCVSLLFKNFNWAEDKGPTLTDKKRLRLVAVARETSRAFLFE